jgi:hypothetical protein
MRDSVPGRRWRGEEIKILETYEYDQKIYLKISTFYHSQRVLPVQVPVVLGLQCTGTTGTKWMYVATLLVHIRRSVVFFLDQVTTTECRTTGTYRKCRPYYVDVLIPPRTTWYLSESRVSSSPKYSMYGTSSLQPKLPSPQYEYLQAGTQ